MRSALERGPRFVSGQAESGQVVLTRDDNTIELAPMLMITGTLVDHGDGTCDVTLGEE